MDEVEGGGKVGGDRSGDEVVVARRKAVGVGWPRGSAAGGGV